MSFVTGGGTVDPDFKYGGQNREHMIQFGAAATADPNSLTAPLGGPHITLGPTTSNGDPTRGFEFSIHTVGLGAGGIVPVVGGFTVTVWKIVSSYMAKNFTTPVYASLGPKTGIQLNELYHSFSVNAVGLYFQIATATITLDGPFIIAVAEL